MNVQPITEFSSNFCPDAETTGTRDMRTHRRGVLEYSSARNIPFPADAEGLTTRLDQLIPAPSLENVVSCVLKATIISTWLCCATLKQPEHH